VDGLAVARYLLRVHPETFAFLAQQPLPFYDAPAPDADRSMHAGNPPRVHWQRALVIEPGTGEAQKLRGGENTAIASIYYSSQLRAPLVDEPPQPSSYPVRRPLHVPTAYQHLRILEAVARDPALGLRLPTWPGSLALVDSSRMLQVLSTGVSQIP